MTPPPFSRIAAGAVALTTAAGLLSACSSGGAPSSSLAAQNILTYLEPNSFRTLYPPSAGYYPNGGVVNQITDRLLYQDPETLQLSPWIATALPTVNEDATEYTFDIRTDVTYSDGTPLTAENVVKNFDLFGKGDKSRTLTTSEQITNYDRGEVIDKDTVRFHFTAPAPGFAQATSGYNAGLLSDATLDKTSEGFAPGQATTIIGSGPFVISAENLGTSLTLTKRADYDWAPPAAEHQGPARIDEVRYILAEEDSVRVGGLVSGQADIARQIEAPIEAHLLEKGLKVQSYSTNAMANQIGFRFNHPLLQDIRVRQAFIAGVDREDILTTLFSPSYPLATSTMSRDALGYVEQKDAYVYDPEKANRLLDEAGWTQRDKDGIRVKDGVRLSLNVNEALPQPRSREVIAKIQEHLARVGIHITLNPGDMATQDADSKDQNKVQLRHTMVGRADYDVIKSLYYSTNRDTFLNLDKETETVHDPVLEELLFAVASSAKESDRAAASAAVQKHITENAYALPLFEEPQVYGVAPYVKGFRGEAVARPSFYGAWIDQAELAAWKEK